MIIKLLSIILLFTYLISTIIFVGSTIQIIKTYKKIFKRFKSKFPKKEHWSYCHPFWVTKLLIVNFANKNNLNFFVTGKWLDKTSIELTHESLSISGWFSNSRNDLLDFILFPFTIFLSWLDKKKVLEMSPYKELGTAVFIIFLPFKILQLLPKCITFYNKIKFDSNIFVDFYILYIFPSLFVVLICYLLSVIPNNFGLMTLSLYLIFYVIKCYRLLVDKDVDSFNIIDKSSIILSNFMNIILSCTFIYSFIYYKLYILHPETFITEYQNVSFFDMLFFSVSVFSSIGNATIMPNGLIVKYLAISEVFVGIFVLICFASIYIDKKLDEYNKFSIEIKNISDLNKMLKLDKNND